LHTVRSSIQLTYTHTHFGMIICSWKISVGDSGEDFYWAWAASVSGLVLHILAVVHAVLWGLPSLIVGSLV